jgi:hypothetical protein
MICARATTSSLSAAASILNLPPLKACLSQNRSACPIAARIGKEAKDALIKAALRQNRTVANLVETIIREWLEKTGYLKRKH